MELHGRIEANLIAAIRSARRLRGYPIHQDTLQHWTDVLHQARRELSASQPDANLKQLVVELETELAERSS